MCKFYYDTESPRETGVQDPDLVTIIISQQKVRKKEVEKGHLKSKCLI